HSISLQANLTPNSPSGRVERGRCGSAAEAVHRRVEDVAFISVLQPRLLQFSPESLIRLTQQEPEIRARPAGVLRVLVGLRTLVHPRPRPSLHHRLRNPIWQRVGKIYQ